MRRKVMKKTKPEMAYVFPSLLFLLLLLSFVSHGYQCNQTCPEYVPYHCPDFSGNSVKFPFTNSSRQDCGLCILTCNQSRTTIECGEQELSYKTKQIFPNNSTIVLVYPGLHKLITSNICNVYQSHSVTIPNPPLTSLTILNPIVFFRCSSGHGNRDSDSLGNLFRSCDGDTVYGPYPVGEYTKRIPSDCTATILPNSTDDDFSVKYKLPDECSRCALDMTECVDQSTGRIKCPAPLFSGKTKLAIVITSGCFAMIIIFLAVLILYWRKRNIKLASSIVLFNSARSDQEEENMNGVKLFSYNQLKEATHNFSCTRELGEGGFGIVYHGKLRDGREVAVKRLYEKSYKRIQQFNNEIKILTDLRHKNLVTLYGCTSNQCRDLLLVYEYIPNLTVADHLHGHHPNSQFIPWSTRLNIAIETAEALSYLHHNDIIHRDVKSNNILVDNNFSVKVADLGLSRFIPTDVTHVSTAPQGTPGYLDPEYHHCYHLTDKSDVYSFGVVLVELLSSLKAVDVGRNVHEINLSNYAIGKIQVCAFGELIDTKLGFETDSKVRKTTTMVAELAFQCLQQERQLRPSMEEVLHGLQRIASLDYDAPEIVDKIQATKSEDDDDVVLLKNAQLESVRRKWISRSLKTPSIKDSDVLKVLTISKMENDDIRLLENAEALPSPDSVMDKWSSKSTRSDTSSRDSVYP